MGGFRFVLKSTFPVVLPGLLAAGAIWGAREPSAQKTPDRALALLQDGLAQRALGLQILAQVKPGKAAHDRARANQHFESARDKLAAASAAFAGRVKKLPGADEALPPDLEWAACARSGQAEMELRLQKTTAAKETLASFFKEPAWKRTRYHRLALYYHGFASFFEKDYLCAGRSLNQLAPFTDPVFGTHARYLLARVLHQSDERPEAVSHYEGVLAEYDSQKKQAAEAVKQPDTFRNDPTEKAGLLELVNAPPPEHVGRARFYLGLLYYESGRFADALTRFADFCTQQSRSPLRQTARLFQGCAEVQLRQFPEGAQTLQPLVSEQALAGPALFWLGKCQAGAAESADEDRQRPGFLRALETLRQAETAAAGKTVDGSDRTGRGAILLEMAELQQRLGQPKEAATLLAHVLDRQLMPGREQEVWQRRLTALNLAGDYQGSDALCTRFLETFPRSTLLPEVLFRQAENAFFLSMAADPGAILSGQSAEVTRLNETAAARYQQVVDRFPEYPCANMARYSLAWTRYRKGEMDRARAILETIPAPERRVELTEVPYLLADCLLRLAPASADDALAAGRLQEQLNGAAGLLGSFVAEHPESRLAADALLRLALCQQRLAGIQAQADERNKLLGAARASYERILLEYPLHELGPRAAYERAKCLARAGDANEAINRLRSFTFAPLAGRAIAPLAQLQLATLLRAQDGKAAEAAQLLNRCLKQHEKTLLQDKTRAAWVPILQYHYGVALLEAGSFIEARSVFETVIGRHPAHSVALEAVLRLGQCLRDEGGQKIERGAQALAIQGIIPEEAARATKNIEEGKQEVREAIAYFLRQAKELEQKNPASPVCARLLYEAVWMVRPLADAELEAARVKLQQQLQQKLQEAANKRTAPGQTPPAVPPPEVPLANVELQAPEKRVRALYEAIIAEFPDLPLAIEARLELAELLAARQEYPAAIKLLGEALDKEPPADMTNRLRLRLGMCHLGRGDLKGAQGQFEAVAGKPEESLPAQAHFRAGDCLVRQGSWAAAVKHLALFRDHDPLKNQGGLTDPALLQLGRALGAQKQWDLCRQAYEAVPARFGDSPWVHEARYGIGWTWQQQRQYPKAVEAYRQALADSASEPAARALLQIGICQEAAGSPKEAVASLAEAASKTAYPEIRALALIESAHLHTKLGQPDLAEKLLRQTIHDFAGSSWSEVATKRLKNKDKNAQAPHELPAAVGLLTPGIKLLPLEAMGQQQIDRTSLDDPAEKESQAATLVRRPPLRPGPASWLPLVMPDPFEHRQPFPFRAPPEVDQLPLGISLRGPQP